MNWLIHVSNHALPLKRIGLWPGVMPVYKSTLRRKWGELWRGMEKDETREKFRIVLFVVWLFVVIVRTSPVSLMIHLPSSTSRACDPNIWTRHVQKTLFSSCRVELQTPSIMNIFFSENLVQRCSLHVVFRCLIVRFMIIQCATMTVLHQVCEIVYKISIACLLFLCCRCCS